VKTALTTPEERLRRAQRDRLLFRRRSLERRTHARFGRDLCVIPHLFLARESLRVAELRAPASEVLAALMRRAVWTLDTAVRLAGLRGFLVCHDLAGYVDEPSLQQIVEMGLVGTPGLAFVSVDPILARSPLLIVRPDVIPPSVSLPSGHRVVPWDHLARDIMGTIGWRPDILARLERSYSTSTDDDARTIVI
jgi:hypothetical protein